MNNTKFIISMLLGAAFLLMATTLCTLQQNAFSSPESDYELSLLPLNDFERSQVITVGNPEPQYITTTVSTPITITSTQQIEINNDSYILITYSDLSTQLVPIEQYQTEIHVSVSDNNHHDHKKHIIITMMNGHRTTLTKNMETHYQTMEKYLMTITAIITTIRTPILTLTT